MTPNPNPAPDMAVEAILKLADDYANSAAQVSLDKFVNKVDDEPARIAQMLCYAELETALRAALARPQEVAGVTEQEADAAYRAMSSVIHIDSPPAKIMGAVRRALEGFAASRAPVAVGVEPDMYEINGVGYLPENLPLGVTKEQCAPLFRCHSAGAGGSVGAEPANEQGQDADVDKAKARLDAALDATPAPSVPLGGGEENDFIVPRKTAYRTWMFLAQDCSPCAHPECQIDGKNVGVDGLVAEWTAITTSKPIQAQDAAPVADNLQKLADLNQELGLESVAEAEAKQCTKCRGIGGDFDIDDSGRGIGDLCEGCGGTGKEPVPYRYPDQTIFAGAGQIGNCFQASLAGVLGRAIDAVPHFPLLGMVHWMTCVVAWLEAEHHLIVNTEPDPSLGGVLPRHIINGVSKRGIRHAVVGDTATGEMLHDPHPSRDGLVEIQSRFYFHYKPADSAPVPAGVQGDAARKSLNAKVADTLRPFLKPGQKVIWREPFRWFDDNGVLSNHYDGMDVMRLAEDFEYEVEWEFCMQHAAIVGPKLAAQSTMKA